jgi:hypothetical protein
MKRKISIGFTLIAILLLAGMASAMPEAEDAEEKTVKEFQIGAQFRYQPRGLLIGSGKLIETLGFWVRAEGTGSYNGPIGEDVEAIGVNWDFSGDSNAIIRCSWPAFMHGLTPIRFPPYGSRAHAFGCGPFYGEVTQSGDRYTIKGAFLSGSGYIIPGSN